MAVSQNNLIISEINVYPIKPKDGLIGFASLVLNDSLYVGGIAIHTTRSGGIRLVYPVKTIPNGKELPVCHPINRETGESLTQAVAGKLKELTTKMWRPNPDVSVPET